MLRRRAGRWDGTERRAPATVLVANDDPAACEMLVRMIGATGYRSVGATSADAVTEQLPSVLPRCIVLDLSGGGFGATLQALDAVRNHSDARVSAARVVVCAANDRNRSFAFQSGADAYLARPFHLDELLAQIATTLACPQDERARHRRNELSQR